MTSPQEDEFLTPNEKVMLTYADDHIQNLILAVGPTRTIKFLERAIRDIKAAQVISDFTSGKGKFDE